MGQTRKRMWAGLVCLFCVAGLYAQNQPAGDGSTSNSGVVAAVPRLIKFSGAVRDARGEPLSGAVVRLTFAVYEEQQGGAALWIESQVAQLDEQGHYNVLLGATRADGLPVELFPAGKARWLGVQVEGRDEDARVLLVSVPYALKAEDAAMLGGRRASDFVLAEQLKEEVRTQVDAQKPAVATQTVEMLTGNPPNAPAIAEGPSTFTCATTGNCVTLQQNGTGRAMSTSAISSTDVVLVQQTGTGYGLWALAAGNVAVFGQITGSAGTSYGVKGQTTSTTGAGVFGYNLALTGLAYGVLGQTKSTEGTAFFGRAVATTGATIGLRGHADSTSGTGIMGQATATSGTTTGIVARVFSVNGTALIVDNTQGGKLLSGQVNGAEKLSVDGSGNVTANGSVTATSFSGGGTLSGTQLISTVASGTAPLSITSNTLVPSLNADLLDGFHAAAFQPAGSYATLGANTFTATQTISSGNLNLPATAGSSVGVINLGGSPFAHAYGSFNTFLGTNAGNFTTTGSGGNTAIGAAAFYSNTTGSYNTATGDNALGKNTSGDDNTATGMAALSSNTAGNFNTATGSNALQSNTSGFSNTASGMFALQYNTTASNNVALGSYALAQNCYGVATDCYAGNNTAVGYLAGVTSNEANANVTGNRNTFLGASSGPGTSTQLSNATAIGANALVSASNSLVLGGTGGYAVKVGIGTETPAEKLDVVGNVKASGSVTASSFVGPLSGIASDLNCTGCVASSEVGFNYAASASKGGDASDALLLNGFAASAFQPAGSYATLGANTFTDTQTISSGNLNLPATAGSSVGVINLGGSPFAHGYGAGNTFLGTNAGNFTTTGSGGNTAIGAAAFYSNTTGSYNIATGYQALYSNTTGSLNTASGWYALRSNTVANGNTASGYLALTGNTDGWYNTAMGRLALSFNCTGVPSGCTAHYNTALGDLAGVTANNANANVSGAKNTFLGAYSGPGTPTQLTNATAVGYRALVSASNSLVLGATGAYAVNVGIGTEAPLERLDVVGNIKASGSVTASSFVGPLSGIASDLSCSGCVASSEVSFNYAASASKGGDASNALLLNGLVSSAFQPAGSYATLGANTFTATQTISSGNLNLPATAGSSAGVINLGGSPFAHGYGTLNTFLGVYAGNFTATGSSNTATGYSALNKNTSGNNNTATGNSALFSNTEGTGNTATGSSALQSNTSGFSNTASGVFALQYNTTASNNVALGSYALAQNCFGVATDCYASNNTAVGYLAGVTSNEANANVTGDRNTFLGAYSGPGTSTQLSYATAIGYGALVSASNSLVLGGTGGNAVKVGIGTPIPATPLHVATGDIYASQAASGVVVKSPDGNTCARIGIDNSGALSVTALTCP